MGARILKFHTFFLIGLNRSSKTYFPIFFETLLPDFLFTLNDFFFPKPRRIVTAQSADQVSVDEIITDGLLTICGAHLNVTSEVIQSNVSVFGIRPPFQKLGESKMFK